MCGGGSFSLDVCLQWSPETGTWRELPTLDVRRTSHVSWTPDSGIGTYLIGGANIIGGKESKSTTTLIQPDGTRVPGFTLKYDTNQACAISDPDTDTVVITGGQDTETKSPLPTVSVYSVQGWKEDLPGLIIGRYFHACAGYTSGGKRVRE